MRESEPSRSAEIAPQVQLPSGGCPNCHTHSAGKPPLPVSEQSLAIAQQWPRLAHAEHRQFFAISPGEIVATGITSLTAESTTLHLEGTVGAVPYGLDLTFELGLPNEQLVARLAVSQPVPYEGSWTFKLHRLSLAADEVAASPAPLYSHATLASASLPNLGGVIGCILKCLGPQVIAIVLACLLSLLTGTPAFMACLVQQAQASLPGVIQCVQQCQ